ncbi:MAG: hypothetical protein JRN08_05845 [Nitrososphaerota archaeon]|nr:hypothetical protein [Nitrososphaerota archaeon]
MAPRNRRGVSTYLEVFVLIGLAVAGSGVVLGAGLNAASSSDGPALSLLDATVHQGRYFAVESVAIYNTGDKALGRTVLSTGGVPASSTYCYALYDPLGGTELASTCPAMATDPASVVLGSGPEPGRGVLVVLTVEGSPFAVGSSVRVAVTTDAGAQQSTDVGVSPG